MSTEERAREHPYKPRVGDTVRDAKGRVGRVMGDVGGRYQLRPLNGGLEWDANGDDLTPAIQSDALSGAVAEANSLSRWGS